MLGSCFESKANCIDKIHKPNNTFVDCQSIHPFDPFNIDSSDTFIIGSIPPYRFCAKPKLLFCGDVDWYYGSKDNFFWDIIKEACGDASLDLCAMERRKEFLCSKNIGIFDMICECTRRDCSSSDSNLYNIKLIDVWSIVKANTNIKRLFFTSIFVANLFNRQTGAKIDLKNRDIQNIKACDKELEVTILYSPSPSWARGLDEKTRKNPEKNQIRIAQYKQLCNKENTK